MNAPCDTVVGHTEANVNIRRSVPVILFTTLCLASGVLLWASCGVDTPQRSAPAASTNSEDATGGGALFVMPGDGPLMATFDARGGIQWQDARLTDQLTVVQTPTGRWDIGSWPRSRDWITAHSVTTAIHVEASGAITYRGRSVRCSSGARVRSIDLAVDWQGWVIASGRTSLTDHLREMEPPYPGLELVWFRAQGGTAEVRVLSSLVLPINFFAWGVPANTGSETPQ